MSWVLMNINCTCLQTALSLLIGCYANETKKNVENITVIELVEWPSKKVKKWDR